jgi:group I intron endonuclease
MKTGIIYKYTNKINGKCYVGQTIHPEGRKLAHQRDVENSTGFAFHSAVRKYGWENFEYEVVVTAPVDLLNDLEINIIHMEDAYTKGYNMTEGGGGRSEISNYQKEQIAKNNKERVLTKATRQRMSESAKKRGAHSKEVYQKAARAKSRKVDIYCYITKKLLYKEVYLNEFCNEHGYDRARFNAVLSGVRSHHKNLTAKLSVK